MVGEQCSDAVGRLFGAGIVESCSPLAVSQVHCTFTTVQNGLEDRQGHTGTCFLATGAVPYHWMYALVIINNYTACQSAVAGLDLYNAEFIPLSYVHIANCCQLPLKWSQKLALYPGLLNPC